MASTSPSMRSTSTQSRTVDTLQSLVVEPARFAGFWTSVTLPFVLFGLLATRGLTGNAWLLAVLLAVNLLALRLGQQYKRA